MDSHVFDRYHFLDTIIQGHVETDMAGDKDNKRSTVGYVFTIYGTTLLDFETAKYCFTFNNGSRVCCFYKVQ